MPSDRTCSECGQPLAEEAAELLCPVCALKGIAEEPVEQSPAADRDSAAPVPSTSSFGDYELIEEISRGGMGVVYKARQKGLQRLVAVKMVLGGSLASAAARQRFLAEARAAAGLQHPNIIAIHEVGEHAGQPFFSMDYVEGQNLAELLRNGPLPPRRAAVYTQTIAEAVHYAHQKGILHRDLKPSNVLIDESDQPRITDFGLAKNLTGDSDLTVSGQLLGSPNFMAPEQAEGRHREVGPASDVYSLGALLYDLITGRPPFQAVTVTEVLRQVATAEPPAPCLLNPSIPRDLETICLKCLEKELGKRYPTAQGLADELGRFLDGRPILARPIGSVGKTWRWCRRNPRLAGALGLAVLSLVAGLVGVSWQWRRAESQRQLAETSALSERRQAYISDINAAQAALKANNPARALELLNRHRPVGKSDTDLRDFEWLYLWQECQNDAAGVVGRLSANVRSLAISRDGRWLAGGSDGGEVKAWNLAGGGKEIRLLADQGWLSYVAFTPDSSELVFTDQRPSSETSAIRAWNTRTAERRTLITESEHVGVPLFSPDGNWFVYAKVDSNLFRKAVALDFPALTHAREMKTLTTITDNYHGGDGAFTADSRSFVFSECDSDRRIGIWEFVVGSSPQYFPGHSEAIIALATSPDGRLLATGAGFTNCTIKLWETPSFRAQGELVGHEGWIAALSFSPDGQSLASASTDQTIRLWDVAARKQKWVSRRLFRAVSRVCFSPDGRTLFSGDNDGTVLRWSLDTPQEQQTLRRQNCGVENLAVAPSGEQFGTIRRGVVWLGDTRTWQPVYPLPQLGSNNLSLQFSADGRFLFAGSRIGEVRVWSVSDRRLERQFQAANLPIRKLLQDGAGRSLVVVPSDDLAITPGRRCRVSIWSVSDWQERASRTVSGYGIACAISPDGAWLAIGATWQPMQVWKLERSDEPSPPSLSVGTVTDVAFSPDSRLLAVSNEGGTVKVWRIPGLREVASFRAHPRGVRTLVFSPNSRRLLTAGYFQEAIKLWEANTWQELLALPGEGIRQVAFSDDGNRLFAVIRGGDLLIRQLPSFAEIEAKERKNRPQ